MTAFLRGMSGMSNEIENVGDCRFGGWLEQRQSMTDPRSKKSVPFGGMFTEDELSKRRAKYKQAGLSRAEINDRLAQAAADRRANKQVGGNRGTVLAPSRISPVFKPNFDVASKLPKTRERKMNEFRAQNVQAEIIEHQRLRQEEMKRRDIVAVKAALKHNPNVIKLASHGLAKKSPEEKAAKKERRKIARELTGTTKGDWWDPILKFGADMVPKLLPMLIGMGDYEEEDGPIKTGSVPTSNSFLAAATGGKQGYQVPFMHTRNDTTRVTHREYIGDLYSTTSPFILFELPINPGMEETFPWVAPIANQYVNYRMCGAVADFVSQGSDYANTAGLGYVAYATQYNPLSPSFVEKREMLNYEFADAVKPSRSMTHWIECRPDDAVAPEKTVRAGTIPANADLRLYDHGRLCVAVGGNTVSGSIIGQLWMSYDIEFHFPKLIGSGAGALNYYNIIRSGAQPTVPLGSATTYTNPANTIGVTITSNTVDFAINLVGRYEMSIIWDGVTAAAAGTVNTDMSTVGTDYTVIGQSKPAANVATQRVYWHTSTFEVKGDNGYLLFDNLGTAIPTGNVDIRISQIPRPPPAAEIFDWQAREENLRYTKFMDDVRAKELVAMGRQLDEFRVKRDANNLGKANTIFIERGVHHPLPDGCDTLAELEEKIYQRALLAIKSEQLSQTGTPLSLSSHKNYVDFGESVLYKDDDGKERFVKCGVLQTSSFPRALLTREFVYCGSNGWILFSSDKNLQAYIQTVRPLGGGTTSVKSPLSSDDTSDDDSDDEEDDFVVLRKVGSYGVCSTGLPQNYFVVRSFDRTKWKWWFLDTNSNYSSLFLSCYLTLSAPEFCDVIDVIIDNQVKPERSGRVESEKRVDGIFARVSNPRSSAENNGDVHLFRKRGSAIKSADPKEWYFEHTCLRAKDGQWFGYYDGNRGVPDKWWVVDVPGIPPGDFEALRNRFRGSEGCEELVEIIYAAKPE